MIDSLVSIITPTYNRSDYNIKAIESVQSQTYPHFEMIIVDDGSTDNTKHVIEPFLQDARIRYFYQENQRQSVARNKGLDVATGDYICFLDSDNYWVANKLERSLNAFSDNPESDIVYGDIVTVDEQGEEISRKNMPRYSGKITRYLLRDNHVSMNTAMVRKKCFAELGGLDPSCEVADDYEMWLRFSAKFTYLYIPEYLAYYRVMKNQISSNKDKRFRFNEQIIRNFQKKFPDAVSPEIFREGWSYFFTRKGRYYAGTGQLRVAMKNYREALKNKPFSKVPWRAIIRLVLLRK
ncbi:MAG: glycosyltransferase [Candidatus Electrothrix sp. AX5]|nr:glycosyltransferase [Candidatus Electrothrix sp. AX5]